MFYASFSLWWKRTKYTLFHPMERNRGGEFLTYAGNDFKKCNDFDNYNVATLLLLRLNLQIIKPELWRLKLPFKSTTNFVSLDN